ncbi:unnamed protein product [Merluccius merluccius]
MARPRQLRNESDFDQLPHDVPVSACIADVEEKKGFIDYYMFVMEVKTKGGSKYLIYRRYSQFLNLHQDLESKYSSETQTSLNTCTLPPMPGKVFIGNKQEIAESRIPELNTYMKAGPGPGPEETGPGPGPERDRPGSRCLPTWLLLDDTLRIFFYQTVQDSQHLPRALRRLRPPTRRV